MSNDPIQPEHRPLPYPSEPGSPPPVRDSYAAAFGELKPSREAVRRRIVTPASFLIIVGILNLLPLFCGVMWIVQGLTMTDAMFEQQIEMQPPQNRELLRTNGVTGKTMQEASIWMGAGTLLLCLLTGLLPIFAGVCMLRLKGYALAVLGSLAAIFSPSAVCLLGLIAGIWALAVLLSADVRGGFSAPSARPAVPAP